MLKFKAAVLGGLLAVMMPVGLNGALADEFTPFEDASRLVSIGGSLTEIVYALGAEDKLVARDSTAVYPPAAFDLPDVGYMRALAPEGVMSVNPTALLVIEGSGPPEVLEVLAQSGVPYVTVPEEHSHAGILNKVRAVGAVLDLPEKAAQLVAEIDAALTEAEAVTGDIAERKRVLFVLSTTGDSLLVSGTDTAADGVIGMSGAVNAVTEFTGYKTLTPEAIIAAKPDVILMMDRGDHSVVDEFLWSDPAIAMTPAGENKSIIRMDGAYLLGFGPRTAAAVRELASLLYPDAIQAE